MSYSERLHKVIPGGAHTYSRGDDQYPSNAPQILERGKGAYVWDADGNKLIDFTKKLAQKRKINTIWLTVNKNNSNSIKWYKKLNFKITKEVVMDIGNGYVMDDYVIQELQKGKGYTPSAQEHIKLLKNRITKFLTNGKTKMFRTTMMALTFILSYFVMMHE